MRKQDHFHEDLVVLLENPTREYSNELYTLLQVFQVKISLHLHQCRPEVFEVSDAIFLYRFYNVLTFVNQSPTIQTISRQKER